MIKIRNMITVKSYWLFFLSFFLLDRVSETMATQHVRWLPVQVQTKNTKKTFSVHLEDNRKIKDIKPQKIPLQIQQEAQLKHIKENVLKKNEIFLYQEGTALGEIIPEDIASKCEILKQAIKDAHEEGSLYEIILPVPYNAEIIKNFSSVLRLPYRNILFDRELNGDLVMWHPDETKKTKVSQEKYQEESAEFYKQSREIIATYGQPLDRLVNILLLAHHLDCQSCDAVKCLKEKFINDVNNILEKFVWSINQYRFALSHYYNTGETVLSGGWGIPREAYRVAQRWSPNFIYYQDDLTAEVIKKRFYDSLKPIDLEVIFELLKKLPQDFVNQWDNQANEISKIMRDDYWVASTKDITRKENLSDVLPKYKDDMLPLLIKWAGKYQSIFMPVLKKILWSWQYNNLENKLKENPTTPANILDTMSLLNEFLNRWHSILGTAEKKQKSKLFYLK